MEQILNQDDVLCELPDELKQKLIYFGRRNLRFQEWFGENIGLIRRKFRNQNHVEDKYDVVAELFFASIALIDVVVCLEYEPFGTDRRAPDFKATLHNDDYVYLEVKRIRRSRAEMERDNFIDLFWERVVQNRKSFGISLYCQHVSKENMTEEQVYTYLINNIDEIMYLIDHELGNLTENTIESFSINLDHYAIGLQVNVHGLPAHQRGNGIRCYGGLSNCPMTNEEYRKFGDIIREKLPQLVSEENNVILVLADNDSHIFEDLEDAIISINDLIREEDENFFRNFGGRQNFLRESRKLGGIVVFESYNNGRLWTNRNAEPLLSDDIIDFIKSFL